MRPSLALSPLLLASYLTLFFTTTHAGNHFVSHHKRLVKRARSSLSVVNETLVRRDGEKYVFMHHIVGNTYLYTQADWEEDIQQIQAKGVDAIALNIGSSEWQRDQVRLAYAAAKNIGASCKLFLSFDYTEMPTNIDDTVLRVNEWKGHSHQFTIDGKPMVSSYSGDTLGNGGWAEIKQRTGSYLMPFVWGQEGNFGSWMSLDSWYCWGCAWPQKNEAKSIADDLFYIAQLGNKYATTISGWMFTHYNQWANKNFYLRGDDWLIVNRWEQLVDMRSQLTFVEMVTWNDWGESDYFGPRKETSLQPQGTSWADDFPHSEWYELSGYFIKWFKTGVKPPIPQDKVYFWARPHLKDATAWGDPVPKPDNWQWAEDSFWAVAFATAPSVVTLRCGTNSQEFNVPQGYTKLKIPLSVGKVFIKMTQNGQTVIDYSPTDFEVVSNFQYYNYNAYVGAATASSPTPDPTITTTATTTTPTPTPTPSTWSYVGCYNDPDNARVLPSYHFQSNSLSIATCQSACKNQGFTMAGVEYGSECWCASSLASGASKVSESQCNMACANGSGLCGGFYAISVYSLSDSPSPTPTTTTTTSDPTPTSGTWSYAGCYNDPNGQRLLTGYSYTSSNGMTPEVCKTTCLNRGFVYAGTEYGQECWCGSSLSTGASRASESDCSMSCSGQSSSKCGASYRISLYSYSGTLAPPPSSQLPNGWSSAGCFTDSGSRALRSASYNADDMTPSKCISYCAAQGQSMAATEAGRECFCGSTLYKDGGSGVAASADQCNWPCTGDSGQNCGGNWKLNLYRGPNAPTVARRTTFFI